MSVTALDPSLPKSETRRRESIDVFARPTEEQMKGKSVRGGALTLASQFTKLLLQTGSTAILARLLSPSDFGLQGMVFTLTGLLVLFKDVGLSVATVQKDVITHEQISALYWINLLAGTF